MGPRAFRRRSAGGSVTSAPPSIVLSGRRAAARRPGCSHRPAGLRSHAPTGGDPVKRLPAFVLLLAALPAASACASKPTRPETRPAARPEARPTTSTGAVATAPRGSRVGADSPRDAVEDFLKAVRAQDLQAMAAVWGTQKGPAR